MTTQPCYQNGVLTDLVITAGGKRLHLAGRKGPEAELALLPKDAGEEVGLPVLLGSGLGNHLAWLMENTDLPVAVVDKEAGILSKTGLRERYKESRRVFWVDDPDPDSAFLTLSRWQYSLRGKRLQPVLMPVYGRIDPAYYKGLQKRIQASASTDFWSRIQYRKFKQWPPRVLLLTSQYFLLGEVAEACRRMGVEHQLLNLECMEMGKSDFIEDLLQAVLSFRPDFILTINHLGVDREGVLMDLLERLQLPLASWFVDNPHLILSMYQRLAGPWTTLFTWDSDNVQSLRDLNFEHVHFLPLGTDPSRFQVEPGGGVPPTWNADVSFVGNSMLYKVAGRMRAGRFPKELLKQYRTIAREFSRSPERSVRKFFLDNHPDLVPCFDGLGSQERELCFEALLTWEATRQYRKGCVEKILGFNPLIVGDRGWKSAFRRASSWRWHPELSYYTDLPRFYPCSKINFNCTSMQMKGAVNQRVFDVPACGAFVLTDHRNQMEDLFEPGREVVCYHHQEEIPDLVSFYLKHPEARRKIVSAARERVLACHTYEHRLRSLFRTMADIYG